VSATSVGGPVNTFVWKTTYPNPVAGCEHRPGKSVGGEAGKLGVQLRADAANHAIALERICGRNGLRQGSQEKEAALPDWLARGAWGILHFHQYLEQAWPSTSDT
jgi:hypothetical protein